MKFVVDNRIYDDAHMKNVAMWNGFDVKTLNSVAKTLFLTEQGNYLLLTKTKLFGIYGQYSSISEKRGKRLFKRHNLLGYAEQYPDEFEKG